MITARLFFGLCGVPFHPFADKWRNDRRGVRREELECLSNERETHGTRWESSTALRVSPSVNPVADPYKNKGSNADGKIPHLCKNWTVLTEGGEREKARKALYRRREKPEEMT